MTGCVQHPCAALMTIDEELVEVQPAAFVTVYVNVPAGIPEIVVLVPVPVLVTAPGLRVNVQVPDAGKPLNTTEPVGVGQVGCVIVPTEGAVGVDGCVLITILLEDTETQPAALVTV